MALLSEANKDAIFTELEDELSSDFIPVSFGRPDGRLAIDSIDQFVEDTFISFNNSLPASVKASLSIKWKLRAFDKVIKRRWEAE